MNLAQLLPWILFFVAIVTVVVIAKIFYEWFRKPPVGTTSGKTPEEIAEEKKRIEAERYKKELEIRRRWEEEKRKWDERFYKKR